MPCYDGRERWDSYHANMAAHNLCAICKGLPADSPLWTPELRQWWADHENMDAFYSRPLPR